MERKKDELRKKERATFTGEKRQRAKVYAAREMHTRTHTDTHRQGER